MFSYIRRWLAFHSQGEWAHRLVEDYEGSLHLAGPFQKWTGWMTVLILTGLVVSFAILDHGPLRHSLLVLILVVSLGHLLLMAWVSSMVKRFYPSEFELWFQGHMKNFAWATVISATLLWFGLR